MSTAIHLLQIRLEELLTKGSLDDATWNIVNEAANTIEELLDMNESLEEDAWKYRDMADS